MFENDGGGTISVGGTINGGGIGGATVKVVNNEIIDGGGTIKAVEHSMGVELSMAVNKSEKSIVVQSTAVEQSMAVNKSEKSILVQSTAVEQSMGVNQSENSIVVGVKGHERV